MVTTRTPAPPGEPQDRDGYSGKIPSQYSKNCKPDGYGGCHTPTPTHTQTAGPTATATPPAKTVAVGSPTPTATASPVTSTSQSSLPVTGDTAGSNYAMYGAWLVIAGVVFVLVVKVWRSRRRSGAHVR
jgi:hypothetical protein